MNVLTNKEFDLLLDIVNRYTKHKLENKKEIATKLFFELKNKVDTNIDNLKLLNLLNDGRYNDLFIHTFIMNTTYFFRNSYHFLDLQYRIISAYNSGQKSFKILCLPCSTGEEAYSLAICLYILKLKLRDKIKIEIIAGDIDNNVLDFAKIGIYDNDIYNHLPNFLNIDTNFVIDDLKENIKIKDMVKNMVSFKKIDLLDTKNEKLEQYDFIFSRNVWFYFSKDIIYQAQSKIYDKIKKGAILYVGIGESFVKFKNIKRYGMGIYQKK